MAAAEKTPAASKKLKVLIVEDFAAMRSAIRKVLESISLDVLEAGNGLEALELLEKQPVDVVFTDLVMPEMDGFELCEEIRRRPNLRHLPVVVNSTHRDAQYVIKALRTGADDYLTKPFQASLAAKVIERAMSHV